MSQKKTQTSHCDKDMQHAISAGKASPLGATITPEGVNFSIYSRYAQAVELWLFHRKDDVVPYQIIHLDPQENRSYHYWHVLVHGATAGLYYGYKICNLFSLSLVLKKILYFLFITNAAHKYPPLKGT